MDHRAEDIQVLDAAQAIRKRPAMYIGDLDADETMSRLVEAMLCGSLDAAVSGRCRHIAVSLHADGAVTVRDDGDGMSLERDKDGVLLAERMLTQFYACRRARKNRDIAEGFCGPGMFVVNALSESGKLELRRDGRTWFQEYREGKALAPLAEVRPANSTGTMFWFKPDPKLLSRRIDPTHLRHVLDGIGRDVPQADIVLTVEPRSA